MEAASTSWRSLGDILLDRGLISQADLERALAEEDASGQRLADILVRRGLVSGHEITDALMEQMKHFGPDDAAPRPALTAVDDAPEAEAPHDGLSGELESAGREWALVEGVPEDEPFEEPQPSREESPVRPAVSPEDVAAGANLQLPKPPPEIIRETDEQRLTAESRLAMLGGIGEGLDRLRGELEAQDLATPPLLRELDATRERVQERRQALSDEIAGLERTREAVERTSEELERLRADLGAKLDDLAEVRAAAAMWNERVAGVESEVGSLVERIDLLARELAKLVDGAVHTPATHPADGLHQDPHVPFVAPDES